MDDHDSPKSHVTLGKTSERNKTENDKNKTRHKAGFVLQKFDGGVEYGSERSYLKESRMENGDGGPRQFSTQHLSDERPDGISSDSNAASGKVVAWMTIIVLGVGGIFYLTYLLA